MLLGWTGMRGVVSLAAALAIPVQINGADFPYRNLILFITFVVILLTLVIQGLTLPILIKRSKVFDEISEEPDEEFRKKMKIGLREQSYLFLKDKYENEPENDVVMQKILQHWEEKTKAGDQTWMNDKIKSILIETLEVQRKYLTELNKDPEINEEIIRTQLYQIDLEEERLKIV
jgi:CPA1 family monovalent cation:H+ antiporter